MSETESELSEDELNSLLSDLENKAAEGGGPAGGVESDDEDIEGFLKELDESAGSDAKAAVKTKSADAKREAELDAKFAELDDLEPANLPANMDDEEETVEGDADDADGEVTKSEDESADSKDGEGVSKKRKFALAALKVLSISLPSILLIWVLGAFLGNWVSAAWLIAIVSVSFSLAVPALARHYVKKGKYMWWAIGLSLALVAALVAPMPRQAGNALQKYGHWPASFVAEVAGWDLDHPIVDGASFFSEQIGGIVPGANELDGKQLGTQHDLDVPITEQPEQPDEPAPTEP